MRILSGKPAARKTYDCVGACPARCQHRNQASGDRTCQHTGVRRTRALPDSIIFLPPKLWPRGCGTIAYLSVNALASTLRPCCALLARMPGLAIGLPVKDTRRDFKPRASPRLVCHVGESNRSLLLRIGLRVLTMSEPYIGTNDGTAPAVDVAQLRRIDNVLIVHARTCNKPVHACDTCQTSIAWYGRLPLATLAQVLAEHK